MNDTTKVQSKIQYISNHRLGYLLILVGIFVISIGSFTDALDKIITFSKTYIPSNTENNSPEDTIRKYFRLINENEYDVSWNMLTKTFKREKNSDGFMLYRKNYERYARINVANTYELEKSDNRTHIAACINGLLRNGDTFTSYWDINLTLDDSTKMWLIDATNVTWKECR